MHVILDIETVLDTELPAPADPAAFPPPSHHRVVAIGILAIEDGLPRRLDVAYGDDEAANLRRFCALMAGRQPPTLVTWNGRRFDCPVIGARCLRHGLTLPRYYDGGRGFDYRYRFSGTAHHDVKDWLADYGAAPACSLDAVTKMIGLPGKRGIDGSQVGAAWANGERERVAHYCLEDVVGLAFVWLRSRLLAGVIDEDAYRMQAAPLWDFVAKDDRIADMLLSADRGRLLLTAGTPHSEAAA